MDDKQAIANLKQGKLIGLEVLVKRYQHKALQTALMVVKDRSLAEDVVQLSFIKAYENIQRFQDGYPFPPWFFKIVLNQAINTVKRDSKLVSLDEEPDEDHMTVNYWIIDPQPSPEEMLEQAQSVNELRVALDKLKPEHRAALVMRYYLGYDDKTSAAKAQQPLSTIKWWLRAAHNSLREYLQRTNQEERKFR